MVEELEITEQVEQQQDPPTKKRALYDAVSKKYNLGSYEEFETKLKDPTKRKALYDHVGKEFELGTFQEFETKLQEPTPSKKKVGTVATSTGEKVSSPTQSKSLFGNFGTKDEYIAANPSYKPENVLQPPKQLAVKDETRLPKPIVGETLDAELANRERYQKTKDDKPSKIIAEMKSNVPESLGGTMTKEKASLGTALAKGFSSVASSTLKSIGVAAKDLDFFNEYEGKKAEDLATYKAGVKIDNWVSDLVGDLSPEDQERFSIKLAQGAGQMAGFVLGGIGGKALKISPLLTTAGLGAAVSGASEYEAAMQAGANPDQASKAFWINAGLGTTEALPIMSAFRKMDKYTGGLATGVLAKKLSSTAGGRLTNEMAGGILYETAQETFVQALSNVAAANTYDTTRKIYDGLLETAGISSIIGGAMTGASIAIRNKREAGGLTKEEDNQLAIAQKFAEEKAEESFNPDKKELTTTTPDNPKVKAITKAKTDIEADLASTDLPKETQDAMQMEVAALDQQLEEAKTEAYQQELDVENATIIKSEIAKNEALLADGNLSETTKAFFKKQIDTDKEKLSQIKVPEPSGKSETATTEVTEPLQQNEPTTQEQGTETTIPESIETIGQGNAEAATPVSVKEETSTVSDVVVDEVKEGFTEGKDLNRIFAASKSKYGEKNGVKYNEAANRLVNPNTNTIIEVRSNGVVVKEGGKYLLKPFTNTDANYKKWELAKPLDVTEQYVKPQPTNEAKAKASTVSDVSSGVGDVEATAKALENIDISNLEKLADIYYHGNMGESFRGGKWDKYGELSELKDFGNGIHLGTSEQAKEFLNNSGKDGYIYKVKLNAKNIKEGIDEESKKIEQGDLEKYKYKNQIGVSDALKYLNEKEGSGNYSFVVFDPNKVQIISAVKFEKGEKSIIYDNSSKAISEAYHKAKSDGTNPELVKAVEEIIDKTQPTNEAKAIEVQQPTEVESTTIKETNKVGEGAEETITEKIAEPPVVKEFDKMATSIPNGGEVKKYLSGDTIKKYEEGTELRNNQEITAQELEPALKHGVETIDKAKEIFGDGYVEKTLDYIEREKLNPENKALLYVSLENDMAKRILAEPDNLGLKKLQDLVRTKSQAYLRSNSLAINMGRLRKFAEAGYDISKVTDKFFSSKELEQKAEVEKAVQADAETIQKQYEESKQEVSGFSEADIEAKVKEGIESEIAKIYEALPKEKKTAVDKAISALDKIHEKLKNKTYSDATGMTALVDAGVVTIRAALKAGVTAAKAVELGIAKIKKAYEENYGKKWEKEDEFRKDYLDGLKEQGVIDAQQRRQAKKEYQMLETERNRQLAKVADLTEKLNTLQKGERPATNTNESKPDVPEIEALKAKVKEETQKLNALDAQQRRIDELETELDRLQNRLPKEKSETVKREISDKEQELKGKIEAEKEVIRKENKENNQLRLSDAKDAVRQRIEKIKKEIANKERELKEQNKPLNEDLELTRLREVEKQITELRDKYLPEEKDPYEAEKQRERVKDKLVADIIGLNDQINVGERNKKSDKPNYENDAEINKLKKIREDKKAILNEIDPLAVPKEKTTAERKVDAENNLQKKIDDIREEILNNEREVSKSKDKIQSKKLIQLREQKKALEALRDKYLPKGKDPYADNKAAKLVEDKLIKENIELNRQILKGEKDVKENKTSPESESIDKLKAERDARKEMLESIDPTPKQYIENALIEQGFGKTIKIKTKNGLEERQVLDWKKLAGEEGSVSKISENVSKSLEKSGFTTEQLDRISDNFITEYTNIRKGVIEKGLNELASRNKTTVTPAQKSAAKKLAEMYNYGLFDKEPIEFEKALTKAIGVDKLNEGRFQQVKELGDALATLFSSDFKGKRLSEREMKSAIQVVEDKMRHILHQEAKQHGSTSLMLADMARTYMDAVQRMTLNNLKQALENPLSGQLENIYSSIGYTKDMPKELGVQRRKMAVKLYKEMVLQGGTAYGDVSSTFVNKGNLEMMLKNMPESQLLHGITSTLLGRSTLDAVDSFYKAKITNQKFTYNLIQILTKDRLVNGKIQKGMSKEDAKKYVAEKLTGQSFKDAQETAKTIINKVNEGKKEKVLKDSPEFVDRLANDIVTASLANGEKITEDMVTASYNAAYKAAGRGLGHVANNWISRQVGNVTGEIETRINDAIKEKDYRKAALLTMESIFFRNIANPFVGGGTNWVVLRMEKTGLGLVSGLGSMMRKGAKMDLTSETGIKNLEKAMYENMKIKDKFIRGAVGGLTTALIASLFYGIVSTDEYRKWRNKNMWAARYLDSFTPELVLATMAAKDDKMKRYLESSLNQNEQFDKTKKLMKATVSAVKGDKQAALGQSGEVAGGIIGLPIPWRLVRDGVQIAQGASGGEVYKVNNSPSQGILEGYFKGGLLDFAGLNPKEGKKRTYSDETEKIIKDNDIKITNPEKKYVKDGGEVEMTEEEYDNFTKRIDERIDNALKQIRTNGLTNGKKDKESIKKAAEEAISYSIELAKYELFGSEKKPAEEKVFINDFVPLPIEEINKK